MKKQWQTEDPILENWKFRSFRANYNHYGGLSRPPYVFEDLGEVSGLTGPWETLHVIKCTNAKGFWVKVGFSPTHKMKSARVLEEGS